MPTSNSLHEHCEFIDAALDRLRQLEELQVAGTVA